jgi:hypothetical protein
MFINTLEFSQMLEKWVEKNDQAAASKLNSNKAKFPPILRPAGQYYRGMQVDSNFIEKLKVGVKFDKFSSWSFDPSLAKKFATDPAYRIGSSSKSIKILINKKFTSQQVVLNVYSVCAMNSFVLLSHGFDEIAMDSAMKESEVLINKGVTITLKDVQFI